MRGRSMAGRTLVLSLIAPSKAVLNLRIAVMSEEFYHLCDSLIGERMLKH